MSGAVCFDLYIQYSKLGETKMQGVGDLYSVCYVWVGGFSGGFGDLTCDFAEVFEGKICK